MAAVTFRLRHNGLGKDKKPLLEPVAIQVYYYHEGISIELSTGIKVKPENWNGSRATGDTRASRINKALSALEKALYDVPVDHRSASKEQHETIVRQIIKGDRAQKKTKKQSADTAASCEVKETNPVFYWMRQFIKVRWKKKSTRQVYDCTVDHMKGYAVKNGITITWESLNMAFYHSFKEYLYSLGHNDNTVGKYLKKGKHLISEGFENDEHFNHQFKKKAFKASIEAETDEIYLSEVEIIKIYNLDIPELENVKKRFVFSCWIGLRFGDISKLSPHQFQKGLSGPMLRVVTEKTNEEVFIPLHPIAEEIWNSWQKCPPKNISNPEFNKQIKKLAKHAKLNEIVQKRNTIKGEVTIKWMPKYSMVKAHTTRRSFATNCVLMNKIPVKSIMAITGHKTEKAFYKYVRITKAQHAELLAKAFKSHVEEQQAKMEVNRDAVSH